MPLTAGQAYVDIVPDLRKFGDSLKRLMQVQSSGLQRQTDQLSSTVTRSFDKMGSSANSAAGDMGSFGDTAARSNEQTKRSFLSMLPSIDRTKDELGSLSDAALDVKDRLADAQEGVKRAAIGLQQAQQRLALTQKNAAGDADKLALAQSQVEAAQLRVSRSTRQVDRAQRTFNATMADTGRDSKDFSHAIAGSVAHISQLSSSLGGGVGTMQMFGGSMSMLKWPTLIAGANLGAAAISALGAAAVGVIAALAPLGGLLATIPATLTAVVGAVGTASLGFFGVGDALTAMGDQATASVPAVGGAAGAAQDAGRRVADAGRAVEAAQSGVADANRAVLDSERSLADAQRQVQYAQESLTDAREDARQTLQDLNDEVEGGALSEEQAKLRILQARQSLREAQRDDNATRLDIRQSILDVKQAEFDLGQVREENRENQQALNEAERAGISGSEQVISARRGLADANRGVADAERALAEAHRGVADAQLAVTDAQRGVTEAMQAGSPTTTAATSETTALAEAMAKLSPAGREFVQVLFAMKPKLDALRATAQEGLLPGVGRSIQTLGRELFPILNKAVRETASTMGKLAVEGTALVTSGPWKRDFATLLSGNSRLLRSMAEVSLNLAGAFRHIAIAGQPLAFWLGRVAARATESFRAFFEGARKSGGLAEFFDRTRGAVRRLSSIFGNLASVIGNTLNAGQGFGRWFLRQLDSITKGWADFTGSVEGQNALKKWFNDAKPVLIQLGKLTAGVVAMFGQMATTKGLPQLLKQLRTEFLPVLSDIFATSTGKLIPALVELATNFAKVFKVFGTEHGFMITFVKSLTALFGAIARLVSINPALTGMLATIGTFAGVLQAVRFASFLTGIGSLAKGLGGLGAIDFRALGAAFAGVRSAALGLWAVIMAHPFVAIGVAVALLVVLIVKNWDKIKRVTVRIWQAIYDKIEGVWKPIRHMIRQGVQFLTNIWDRWGNDIMKVVRTAWNFVTKAVGAALDVIRANLRVVMAVMRGDWRGAWDAIKDALRAVWDGIKDVLRAAWEVVKAIFANAYDAVKRAWSNAWTSLKDSLRRIWDGIFDFIRRIPERIVDFFKTLPGKLRDIGELAIKAFADGIGSGESLIGAAIKGSLGGLTGGLSNIIGLFGDAGDGLGRAGAAAALGTGKGSAGKMATAAMAAVAGPQSIRSGYRTPAANAAVGGSPTSYHLDRANPAQDIGGTNLLAVAQWLVGHFGATAREIIHTPLGFSISHGARVPPIAASDHYDHVHLADKGGVFKGPGVVGIGSIKETVFQPAEKIGDLPSGSTMVNHFHQVKVLPGDIVRDLDWLARTRAW